MVYCENCGDPLAYQVESCTKCGTKTSSAPRAIPGKHLDPKRFAPGAAEPVPINTNVGNKPAGGSQPARESGALNPSLVGTYEFIRPGSFEKSKQNLVLNANGTCSYSEVGETSMEKFTTAGEGTWDVSNSVVRVLIGALTRDVTFKSKPIVPGIKEGRTVEYNISIPITEPELANATNAGTNKWRVVSK